MKDILFILTSALEHSVLFILIMSLFRFNIRSYIYQIPIFSFIPSLISYFFISINLHDMASGFQIISVMLIFIIGFKEKILYSIWITIAGYFIFTIIQSILIGMLVYSGFSSIADLTDPLSYKQRIVQIITVVIVCAISHVIKRTNDGFSFTLNEKRIKSSKYIYIAISLLAITFFILMTYLAFSTQIYLIYFIGLSAIALIVTIMIFIMSIIQNKKYFDYQQSRFAERRI